MLSLRDKAEVVLESPFARGRAAPRRDHAVVWPDLRAAECPPPIPRAEVEKPVPVAEPVLSFAEDEVARLCASAASVAAADAEARVRSELAAERQATEVRLAGALGTLAGAIAARREAVHGDAVPIGAALGRLLAYEAIGAEPLAVAEVVAAALLAELRGEPEVAVEVAPALVDELGLRLAALAARTGTAGLLDVRAGAGLRLGEVRVLWRDGWAERLLAGLEARAGEALAALAGGGAAGGSGGIIVEGDAISEKGTVA